MHCACGVISPAVPYRYRLLNSFFGFLQAALAILFLLFLIEDVQRGNIGLVLWNVGFFGWSAAHAQENLTRRFTDRDWRL